MERGTGFHPSDPDWTKGRQEALGEAEAIARRQDGLSRKITMKAPTHAAQAE